MKYDKAFCLTKKWELEHSTPQNLVGDRLSSVWQEDWVKGFPTSLHLATLIYILVDD